MAYINQDMKKEIAKEIKTFVPKSWKWSLKIGHSQKITFTLWSAPEEFGIPNESYVTFYEFKVDEVFSTKTATILKQVHEALNNGNHNNNDIQSDYFDVGWYTGIQVGSWDKLFTVK